MKRIHFAHFALLLTAGIVVSTHQTQAAQITAQWLLDGNANDSLGFSNGTATNVQWVSSPLAGQSRTVAYFDGTAGISVPENIHINPGSMFTLSGWVNVATWKDGGFNTGHVIFGAGGVPGSAETAYGIGVTKWSSDFNFNGQNDYPANSQAIFERSFNPAANLPGGVPDMTLGVNPNEWHFYTWTYDGQVAKSYLDSVLLQSVASYANNSTNVSPYTNFGTLRLGKSHGDSSGNMNGYLSDLRLYNGALTQTEVQQLYVATPEPSTALLGLIGFAIASQRRRRTRNTQSRAV